MTSSAIALIAVLEHRLPSSDTYVELRTVVERVQPTHRLEPLHLDPELRRVLVPHPHTRFLRHASDDVVPEAPLNPGLEGGAAAFLLRWRSMKKRARIAADVMSPEMIIDASG